MALKQISVYLENSPGRLLEVTRAFGEAGINLKALSLTGTSGFGVLRLIVSDLKRARNIAMDHHWPARVDDVLAIRIPDIPGSLAALLTPLKERRIDVEYMYAFTGFSSTDALMVLGFKDIEAATVALGSCDAEIIDAEEFGVLESGGKQRK
jgi:hypothetical protein